jgi:hypothetical protein
MSGAASIAAAKNRRTKPDPNQKPIISCSTSKSGSCPLPPGSKQPKMASPPSVFDEESLRITGPMPLMQVLKVHEQRLNKIDEKLIKQLDSLEQRPAAYALPTECTLPIECQEIGQCDAECYDRINILEEKVHMLEEVIMNLQLTLTNVQSFAMESSLAMLKLQNQIAAAAAVPVPSVVSLIETTPSVLTPSALTPSVLTPSVPTPSVLTPSEPEVTLTVSDVDTPETN